MRVLAAVLLVALAPAVRAQDTVLFHEDFEAGLTGWTTETLWHLQEATDPCSPIAAPFPSGSRCAWFGSQVWCGIADTDLWGGPWFDGFLTQNGAIDLPATARTIRLSLRTKSEGEDDGFWDRRSVEIEVDGAGPWLRIGEVFSSTSWQESLCDLTPWAGRSVRLRLEFWTGDSWSNDGFGWFVDDVTVTAQDDPAIPFCTGDGMDGSCPCGNVGAAGRGCPSSFDTQGARLAATGTASLTGDTLAIQASGVSQAVVTFFASTTRHGTGWHAPFGDGRRCVVGNIVRARSSPDAAGAAQVPILGGPTLGQHFNVTLISPTRYVQALYRNSAAFCTNATYNLTNGLIVTWRP